MTQYVEQSKTKLSIVVELLIWGGLTDDEIRAEVEAALREAHAQLAQPRRENS